MFVLLFGEAEEAYDVNLWQLIDYQRQYTIYTIQLYNFSYTVITTALH